MLGFTASRTQIAAYLFGVALFSISFLVFLNSAISFVITQRIGQRHNVGNAVGTLGFADELVALVACPAWGLLSDRVGVRAVAVLGYTIVGISLWVFVQAKNVYPQLLLARLFFSLGATATSVVVPGFNTALTLTQRNHDDPRTPRRAYGTSHTMTPSISSELTITPARFQSNSVPTDHPLERDSGASASHLAGLVGMFTGCGALVALLVFLPLPTQFQKAGRSPGTAIADAFYVVGAIALLVAGGLFFGLRRLPGEEGKALKHIWHPSPPKEDTILNGREKMLSLPLQFWESIKLGFKSRNVGLGYLGGFVARASSVAVSLYIPLFTNTYFLRTGECSVNPDDPLDIKHCARAYKLAAALTGVSQLVALIMAPFFGFLSARYPRFNIPLLSAALAGVVGYCAFGALPSPDPRSHDGSGAVFLVVALLGFSQIGAIVCSLGLLARGIHNDGGGEDDSTPSEDHRAEEYHDNTTHVSAGSTPAATPSVEEEAPLLTNPLHSTESSAEPKSLDHLKGTIAGTYSLFGGAGILLLTKAGGALFDSTGPGSPFFMMASFNALLLVVCVVLGVEEAIQGRRRQGMAS
ncbi:MFS general substrate transporter [Westerdykella ornata]|uniref:MFS general substrate transporter n=1 Tax=Westerdykella ornata TaxID=318751 RepID=A0A6A6JJP9_WESOR|nr:MFS general substrate transporter [Westerdykella ornata]KAF2275916.1 MFS general substrate transporter [Westerdykella ornata]